MGRDEVTNLREQMALAAEHNGERLDELDCFYHPWEQFDEVVYDDDAPCPVVHCRGDELPEREYHCGFGGVGGEPVVAFSERFVYFRVGYDGAEWISSVPRSPAAVGARIVHYYGGG